MSRIQKISQRIKKRQRLIREWVKKNVADRKLIKRLRRRGPTVMYDSIDLSQIPKDAPAVAGYTSGNWPTYKQLVAQWPHAEHLSIAVSSREDAECLDIEPGDATPGDAAIWVKRQRARGVKKPVVYSSISSMQSVLTALKGSGISRNEVRVWTAHYSGHPHLCTPACGYGLSTTADATQWTDHANGKNLDQSQLSPRFF